MVNEKTLGIISLTSYPARIKNVGKTIYRFIKMCPEFHIVLNLCSLEFSNKEKDLPEDLRVFQENGLIEILWHDKNYRVLMKTLFAIAKYKDFPVISADDDNYPKINYPMILYKEWLKDKTQFISFWGEKYKDTIHLGGNFTLTPPYAYGEYGVKCLTDAIIETREDDPYYTVLRHKMGLTNCRVLPGYPVSSVIEVHDEINPLHNLYRNRDYNYAFDINEKEIVL